jgi:Peptide N-acetyl-beta-D-glucosaminyl asparaginase amidase A
MLAQLPRKTTKLLFVATLLVAATLSAQVVIVPKTPQVGSSNPANAEPLVSRPHGKPCVVPLFNNLAFADFTPKVFNYTPPANCQGPWSKVVFTADFTVSAGRQYDRTAAFYLGHANIFYGTTAEPRHTLSPSWHVERDVTDLSAILRTTQTGEANIGNFVGVYNGVTYDGIIYANAALEFYKANDEAHGHADIPDIVVPVEGPGGDAGTLNTTGDQVTQTLNLPTNVERVYLDVIAQSQSGDEFWYICVPNNDTATLQSCGNTAFRETEITIDGQPAGVAPVYPWIFTGGIDPYLWEPITGIQTLNFKPYRVDLTPFAGLLADGNTHTIGVGVYNANSYFLATANLLVYTDPHAHRVYGGVLSNTLTTPTPVITDNTAVDASGNVSGNVLVAADRTFTISGYVNTSHGHVVTTIHQNVGFSNNQTFDITADIYQQVADQLTTVNSRTTTTNGLVTNTTQSHVRYPLNLSYTFGGNPDGTYYQTVVSDQKDQELTRNSLNGGSRVSDEVHSADTYNWDANFNALPPSNTTSWQSYVAKDSEGNCYSRTLTANNNVLSSVSTNTACH